MGSRKKTSNSDWKDGFLFVGNHLALDFLNTRPVQNGAAVELLPDFPSVLLWFQAAGLLSAGNAGCLRQKWGNSPEAQRFVETLRELRERLRKRVIEWEQTGKVSTLMMNELNKLMASHPMLSRLRSLGGNLVMEPCFVPNRPEDLLAPLAHEAAKLFAEVERSRVRQCGNCVLHFHDNSKKGTRRWCSMQLCGNRLKVAAYSARRRRDKFIM